MEVIDFHTHLLKKNLLNPTTLEFLQTVNPSFYEEIREYADDPNRFSTYLQTQGVSFAVVLPEYAPATSAFIPTEEVLDYCRGQDRLLPFVSLNPNTHTDLAEQLAYYVEECGARGLKLLPSYQYFYPNESRLYPLYAEAQRLRIPVIFHVGSSVFKGTRLKYCDPIHLDDLAVDFPHLNIVMAHSGRGFWYEPCYFLSRLHQNIYMDITGLPPGNLLTYFPELEKNADKVIFGSDWPAMPAGIRQNVDAIRALPLSERALEAILYKNAQRLLFETSK
jgi:hypothetical protein